MTTETEQQESTKQTRAVCVMAAVMVVAIIIGSVKGCGINGQINNERAAIEAKTTATKITALSTCIEKTGKLIECREAVK